MAIRLKSSEMNSEFVKRSVGGLVGDWVEVELKELLGCWILGRQAGGWAGERAGG